MFGIDFSIHGFHGAASQAPAVKAASPENGADGKGAGWDLSFDNLLDIVNPLQHLPVVGTLYRAITGDKIATPEKWAGDFLYGGLIGLGGSVLDTAFEAVTGHNAGDTVLALLTGADDAAGAGSRLASLFGFSAVSATPVQTAAMPQVAPAQVVAVPGMNELMASLNAKSLPGDMAQRAALAYGRGMGLSPQ